MMRLNPPPLLSRRRILQGGLAAIGASLLAACGSPAAPSPSAQAPAMQPTQAGAGQAAQTAAQPTQAPAQQASAGSKGPATIVYWRPVKGKGEENGTKQITEAFSKDNANVTFKVEYIPQETLPQKYQSGLATNTGPDILTLDTEWPSVYAALGALAEPPPDLQNFVKQNAFQIVQDVATYKGKIVAIPQDSSDLFLAYNVKIFKDAGISTEKGPADWDELVSLAQKLTKRDSSGKLVQAGLDFDPTDEWGFNVFLASAGGHRWHNLDGVDYLEAPFVSATQFNQDLVLKHKVWEIGALGDPGDPFTHGKAAMTLAGPWTITGMKQDAPDLEWRSWLNPPIKADGKSGTTLGGWHLGVYAKTKSLDTVWSFLQYHVKSENRILWYKLTARAPSYKDIVNDDIFKSDPNVAVEVQQMAYNSATGIPASPAYLDVRDNVTQILDRTVKQKEDVKKVLTEEKAKIDKVFVEKSKG